MQDNDEDRQLIQTPQAAEQREGHILHYKATRVFKVRHQEELTDGKNLFSSKDISTTAWGILNHGIE